MHKKNIPTKDQLNRPIKASKDKSMQKSSQSSSLIRLQSDWRDMERDPPEGCSAAPIDESDLYVWNATLIGPEHSPWEGGIFTLRLSKYLILQINEWRRWSIHSCAVCLLS